MLAICRFGKIQDGDSALFTEIGLSRLSLRRARSPPPARGWQRREKFYLLKGVKKDIIKKISFIKAGIWLRR